MSNKICIPFTTNINTLYAQGLQEAKEYNAKLEGNIDSGKFEFTAMGGSFFGRYKVINNTLVVEFTKKPFMIPMIAIEKFLKSYIK